MCCSTSASPRCSWTRSSAVSRTRRTRRWTCGWTPPAGPTAADVLNGYAAADLARVLREYGEERFARARSPPRSSGNGNAPLHDECTAGRSAARDHPGGVTADRRSSGQAHLPSTSDRGQRRAGRAGASPAGGDRRAGRRWADRGALLPLARGPAGQADARSGRATSASPPDLPVELPEHRPQLRLLTRGAEVPDRPRPRRTRARPRRSCALPSGMRRAA